MPGDKYGLKKVVKKRTRMQMEKSGQKNKGERMMMRNPLKPGNRMSASQMQAMSKRSMGRAY